MNMSSETIRKNSSETIRKNSTNQFFIVAFDGEKENKTSEDYYQKINYL